MTLKELLAKALKEKQALKAIEPQAQTSDVKARINNRGELMLYGVIGDWFDELDAETVVREIESQTEGDIVVRIHSGGGSVMEGLAMYNALKQSPRRVVVHIDGLAASMASAIAMAGDVIYMPANALMMIHKPWLGMVSGNSDDLREYADQLDLIGESYAMLYAEKTGKPIDEIHDILNSGKDYWINGNQAVEQGFADEVTEAVAIAASIDKQQFHNPPAAMLAKLQTVASAANQTTTSKGKAMKFKLFAANAAKTKFAAMIADAINARLAKEEGLLATLGEQTGIDVKALDGDKASDEALAKLAKALNVDEPAGEPEPAPAAKTTTCAQASVASAQAAAQAAAAQAVADERQRVNDIHAMASRFKIEQEVSAQWVAKGLTAAQAREKAFDVVAERINSNTPLNPSFGVTAGDTNAFRVDVVAALCHRLDSSQPLADGAKAFAHKSLLDIAGKCLAMGGVSIEGKSPIQVAAMAMTQSDFPAIVSDVANKVLVMEGENRDMSYQKLARKTTARDFKAQHNIRVDFGAGLQEVGENGEYKQGKIVEGKESYKVKSFGRIFNFSRQLIVNDDLGALQMAIQDLATLAYDIEEETVWALISGNPKLSDNKTLFHADHKNLVSGSGSALDVAGLSTMRALHRKMKRIGGKRAYNIGPSFILVPTDLETAAEQIIAQNLPTAPGEVNPFAGKIQVISSTFLDADAKAWYTVADPMRVAGLQYSHLEGEEAPYIETKAGFEVDGIQIKVRHDFGAGVIGHQGLVKNPGGA